MMMMMMMMVLMSIIIRTRSLGALRAPTSSWRPFGPLNFVLRALWALRPCGGGDVAVVGRDGCACGLLVVGLMMVMVYLHIEDDRVKVSASSRLDSGI